MTRDLHDPARGFTKGMPSWRLLADTRWRLDPTRCKHYLKQFVATVFKDTPGRHQLFQRFRCLDCGKIHDEPRDLRSAGRSGSIEIEDPRVYKTLVPNEDFFKRFHKQEVYDGRHPNKTYRSGLEVVSR